MLTKNIPRTTLTKEPEKIQKLVEAGYELNITNRGQIIFQIKPVKQSKKRRLRVCTTPTIFLPENINIYDYLNEPITEKQQENAIRLPTSLTFDIEP